MVRYRVRGGNPLRGTAFIQGAKNAVLPMIGAALLDEVFTPDSSRFWPADQWEPGRPQQSFDKQFVRDWLISPESGWDKESGTPPPRLPDSVVERTRDRYREAYERITGVAFTG